MKYTFLLCFLVLNLGGQTQANSGLTNEVSKPKIDHSQWTTLLQNHVSNEGQVDYRGFKKDGASLKSYIKTLSAQTPDASWSKQETLAYWINAYNALTIDLILRHYPVQSIKDIKNPWKQSLWTLGGKPYDLDVIEHQILRKMHEPRIHFAIVCASYSCPKLKNSAYTANSLNTQLEKAAIDFINDPKRNDLSENSIRISKIFQWFRSDFEQDGSLIAFLNQYAKIRISDHARIRFKDYNWELND